MKFKGSSDFTLFIKRILIFFLIVFILDKGVGHSLRFLYFKQNHGSDHKITYILNEVTSPVLILGSSRAEHHYVPSIFKDSLRLDCFNTGIGGNYIFYYRAVVSSIIRRYTPKILVVDLLQNEMALHTESYDRITTLLPYYRDHKELREIVELKSKYEKIKLLSAIYPFNSLIIESITGTLDLHNKRKDEYKMLGYEPLFNTYSERLKNSYYYNNIDSNNVNSLKIIIRECIEKKIKLYIVTSPCYYKYLNKSRSIAIEDSIAKKYNIPFYDFSQNDYFLHHPELFFDEVHLNNKGAILYSQIIANKLKQDLY